MGFRVACGDFRDMESELMEKPGTALLPINIQHAPGMFVARGWGDSMLPMVRNGSWLFFHPNVVGTRQHRYVLVEDQSKITGERYTLKKYNATKAYQRDGTRRNAEIRLISLNQAYPDIVLKEDGNYHIRGWYVGQAEHIQRVEPIQYPDAPVE